MISAPQPTCPPHIGVFDPPLRVLYVIDTLEVGGSEQSLLQIVRRLDRRRFEPLVCHVYAGEALRREFEAAGVRVAGLGIAGKYRFARAYRALLQLARDEQPDLIHTTLFRANQIGRAVGRRLRIPVISSLVNLSYDPVRWQSQSGVNRHKLAAVRALDALTSRWVARFHAVSAAVRDSSCRTLRISPERVAVIPRGRSAAEFTAAARPALDAVRRELGTAGAFPTIVNVGRLVDQKSQAVLIRALPEVLRQFPRAKLLIAGDGPLRGELEREVARLGLGRHVSLLGRRDDVPMILALADCFAFPSIYEGLPGAVVEAMFAGRAIVAADIPVVREVIDAGCTGLLVPPKDFQALAEAIVSVAARPELAARLGRNAQRAALQRFEIRHIVREMEQLYAEVARR